MSRYPLHSQTICTKCGQDIELHGPGIDARGSRPKEWIDRGRNSSCRAGGKHAPPPMRSRRDSSSSKHTALVKRHTALVKREAALMPHGIPRYVHCYDNGGKSFDRYTIVFTGKYGHKTRGSTLYIGASAHPFDPQGFGQHGEAPNRIDWPTYGHLGKKVRFESLPPDVQKMVRSTYVDLWELK